MNRPFVVAWALAAMVTTATLGACSSSTGRTSPASPTVIRFGVIVSGGGAELPETLEREGIAARYGFKVEIVPYSAPGQQYTLLRGRAADIVPGNILDLERQRRAGLAIHAIASFQRFSSPIVVPRHSSLTSFTDLRGRRVGQFGPTTVDWLAARTAGYLGTGLDLAHTRLTQAAPALLSSLLQRGQLDATMQFASLSAGPVAAHRERVLTTVPDLLRGAHLDPDSLDVVWDLTDRWRAAQPSSALQRLRAAMTDAYARLKTGSAPLWAPFTKLVGNTEPTAAHAFIAEEIANIDPPFNASLLVPTQRLVTAMVAVAGAKAVGFTTLPSDDFLFPP